MLRPPGGNVEYIRPGNNNYNNYGKAPPTDEYLGYWSAYDRDYKGDSTEYEIKSPFG
jgi:hypothetical protein